ncbi:MAG: class I SAM-dependent methyltransferase [Actinomycetota bacterium]|nr:class I SAM-dependent methyltransferase [Actinomycetota bacterium]
MTKRSAGGRSNRFAVDLFRPLPARYDFAAEFLSFGQNARWRRRMIDELDRVQPQLVLDVATGTAGVALEIVNRTGARVVGLDISSEMLGRGRDKIRRQGLTERIALVVGTGERLPFDDATFDALTFTYLLRYVQDPPAVLRELARVVKPGGRMASLEFSVPRNPMWRSLWWLYTRGLLPLAALPMGRGWYEVGRFLGSSISRHYQCYPVERQEEAWRAAGMAEVGRQRMSLGAGIVMWGTKH